MRNTAHTRSYGTLLKHEAGREVTLSTERPDVPCGGRTRLHPPTKKAGRVEREAAEKHPKES